MRFLVLAIFLLFSSGALAAEQKEAAPAQTDNHAHDHDHDHGKAAKKPALPKLDPKEVLKIEPTDRILGNLDAPVTIFEYSSLSCPHCAHFANTILPVLEEKYITTGKMKLINRDFPLNEPALRAAMIAHCDEKRYYTFLKVFYKSQKDWAFTKNYLNVLKNIARLGGIKGNKVETCLNDKKLEKMLVETRLMGERIGVQSTPTFFVNHKKVETAKTADDFGKLIEEALKP